MLTKTLKKIECAAFPWTATLLLLGASFGLNACIPDVYLIDRQTVLELEASGDWKELDAKYQAKVLSQGPVPLEETSESIKERQLFMMTHADEEKSNPAKALR